MWMAVRTIVVTNYSGYFNTCMDENVTPPTSVPNCFVCHGPDTPDEVFRQATPLLLNKQWESICRVWNVGRRHTRKASQDITWSVKLLSTKDWLLHRIHKESAKSKRKRTCSKISQSVQLLYICKDVCILCKQPAPLYKNNPTGARKKYIGCQIVWVQKNWRRASWTVRQNVEMNGLLKWPDAWKGSMT